MLKSLGLNHVSARSPQEGDNELLRFLKKCTSYDDERGSFTMNFYDDDDMGSWKGPYVSEPGHEICEIEVFISL